LVDVRQQAKLSERYEFSFNALSSAGLRRQVFAALAAADFEAWAVVVDKTALPDIFRVMRRLEFYLYFVTEAIQLVPANRRAGATLILDEFGGSQNVRTELRRFLAARSIPREFRRVLAKRSQSEPLIQVADLVAGAILRRDSRGDVEAYEAVSSKLRRLLEFQA
jgi:hypothetical protein